MKIKSVKQKDVIEWFLIYLFFILHGTNIISFASITTAFSITVAVLAFYFIFGCKISREMFVLFAILLGNYFISGILSGAGLTEGLNLSGYLEIVFVVLGTLLLYRIDGDAMTKYIKLVYVFTWISLVCYLLVTVGEGNILVSIFSKYKSGMGDVAGRFFYVYNLQKPDRNTSIFTEPGIFQGILVMCLYVILFLRERISLSEKQVHRYIIVFLIALITTKSAAGYLGLVAIIVGILLQRKQKQNYVAVAIIIIGIIYLLYNYYTQGADSLLEQYFFGKFAETQTKNLTMSSGGARLVAMQMGLTAAVTHLFGIGYLNWENQLFQIYGRKFGTGNALFTELGTRGFIAFFITIYLAIKPAYKRKKGWIEFGLFCFLFLCIAMVQAKILYPSIMLVAYLGEKQTSKE